VDAVAPDALRRSGAGTPLLLLHGLTASWRVWRGLLPLLEPFHEVMVPTLAGHAGGPSVTAAPHRLVESIVDSVCRQLDEAGLATVHVVGNSFGGWVALELARRGRARSVVALSPAGAWRSVRDVESLARRFRLGSLVASLPVVRRLAAVGRIRRVLFRGLAEHGERLSRTEADEVFDDMAGCVVVADLFAGARQNGPLAPIPAPGCPVRIAWAEKDRVLPFPRYGLPMLAAVPGADFSLMPAVGHVPMHDDPELVARTILEFTIRVDGGDVDAARRLWPRPDDPAPVPPSEENQ
jgi:pimeloyl-ACP methyl ester carboxylesterase